MRAGVCVSQAQVDGRRAQPLVTSPEPHAIGQRRRSQQMDIDVADASAMKPVAVDEAKDLVTVGNRSLRQVAQQFQDRCAIAQTAARDLAEDERMHDDTATIERVGELVIATAQMVDPHGRVDQDQGLISWRLRGVAFKAA